MVEIAEQQQRIREGQVEVRKKFEEIDFECGQLQKETLLISQQAESNQQRLTLMFKILKARAENNFHEAARLTQSLRECMRSGTQSSSQVDVDERGTAEFLSLV
ncbi:hypothetical protein OIU76_018048 [Salix suchowensis]|nr:hypothetical protein OIU76_018048 [Salix suchowensis]